jgi:glycosyltransferase involved in cell wall biosynthesis
MTRVLMVIDGLWNGGAERQLALLASSLPEPWSASVLAMEDGPYRAVLEDLGIEVLVVPRRFRLDVTPAVRMWRAASAIDPDVVHSWGWMSHSAMVPFCRLRGIPLLDGTIRLGSRPSRRALRVRGLAISDAVVANSRAGLAAYGIAEGERGRVVYNGFDPARLDAIAAAPEAAPHERTVAIMAARMSSEKDWRLLLSAARVLARDAGGWKIVAVGSGPDRDALMTEAADLVSAGVVEFPEGGLEVLPIIARSDIGVLLTDPRHHAEGCSNAIMEYMACGLPVVCTDSGGNPELVEDGVTGLILAPRDVDALVAALRALRDEPARAREMGREGRRQLEEHFTVDAMVGGFTAAYDFLLGERRKRRK